VSNYKKVEDALRKIKDVDIAPKFDHPYLSKKSTRAYDAILTELEESRKAMEKLIGSDPYAEKMFDVFEGKVGKCPKPEELSALHEVAKSRYEKLVHPGFADLKEKGTPDAYGDCIAWQQLMDIANVEKKASFSLLMTERTIGGSWSGAAWWAHGLNSWRNLTPSHNSDFICTTQRLFCDLRRNSRQPRFVTK
jgi:PIN like domain